MSQTLNQLNSNNILKKIFSFLDYDVLLKLIKNNKNFKKRAGLGITNYKERTSYSFQESEEITDNRINGFDYNDSRELFHYSKIITITLFIIILIVALLFLFFPFGNLDEKDFSAKRIKSYFKVIRRINLSLFGFLGYIIISYFIIFLWVIRGCYSDFGRMIRIKKIVLIISSSLYLLYDVVIIVKLALSYKISKSKEQIVMITIIGDYFLLLFIFLYFAFLVFVIICYFRYAGKNILKSKVNILKEFRKIKIDDFKLPENFNEMKEYSRKRYIINNKNRFEIFNPIDKEDLINAINDFRTENNIKKLIYDERIYFEDLVFDKYSEHILFDSKHNYKMSSKNYLFIYPINEFKKRFNKKEKNIINILLSKNFARILIIEKDNDEFIFLYKSQKKRSRNVINVYIKGQNTMATEKGPIFYSTNKIDDY